MYHNGNKGILYNRDATYDIYYKCCSHRRRAGEFANVNQEHQAWSDHVGGEINGRFRFVSDLGRFACATVDQVESCSKLSTLLKTTICSQHVDSVDKTLPTP